MTLNMTLTVIQDHRFRYQSKAHMRLPIGKNTNLHTPHRFQVIAQYSGQISLSTGTLL